MSMPPRVSFDTTDANGLMLLAEVRGAHGLGGELKVRHHSQDMASLKKYPIWQTSEKTSLTLKRLRRGRNDHEAIVAFIEVTDRNASEAMIGTQLWVTSDALPSLEEDEYYHRDLIGITAYDQAENIIGTIQALYNYGAGDILSIQTEKDGEYLHPFKPEFVDKIDLKLRRCTLLHLISNNITENLDENLSENLGDD